MCCGFLILVLLGPRFFGAMWWLIQPMRWQAGLNEYHRGQQSLVDLAGSRSHLLAMDNDHVCPCGAAGIVGWDWLWLGLAVFADIAWYTGGAGRKRIPNYQGY